MLFSGLLETPSIVVIAVKATTYAAWVNINTFIVKMLIFKLDEKHALKPFKTVGSWCNYKVQKLWFISDLLRFFCDLKRVHVSVFVRTAFLSLINISSGDLEYGFVCL